MFTDCFLQSGVFLLSLSPAASSYQKREMMRLFHDFLFFSSLKLCWFFFSLVEGGGFTWGDHCCKPQAPPHLNL